MRPFLLSAEVKSRGYSLPLQRRITDFGADTACGGVNKKLWEHYGISVPENGIRANTLKHAKELKISKERSLES